MPVATTAITGVICKADGSGVKGAQIRATIKSTEDDQGGQVSGAVGIISEQIEAFTDQAGLFEINIVAGAMVLFEIPSINLSKLITVPADGPVDFTAIV